MHSDERTGPPHEPKRCVAHKCLAVELLHGFIGQQGIDKRDQAVINGIEEDLDRIHVYVATDVEIVMRIHDGVADRFEILIALLG